MKIIAVYDIRSEKRIVKVLKLFRHYLNWIQNSVFEGELTDFQLRELQSKLSNIIDMSVDSIIFFKIESPKFMEREVFGVELNPIDQIL